jgi:predicted ATP-binding protein involved in virulence
VENGMIFTGQALQLKLHGHQPSQFWTVANRDKILLSSRNFMKVFISYSRRDKDLLDKLNAHLGSLRHTGKITWSDQDIEVGNEWERALGEHLDTADIILLLISADFLASDYCYSIELQRALKRHENREAYVTPVILRACDWKNSPIGKLQVLPTDGKPLNSWPETDEALTNVVKGLRRIIQKMTTTPKKVKNLVISKIEIHNIKCFENLVFDFIQPDQANYWITILGDNAIGKSTLLKSIALGLCRESDAAALIKLSEVYGDFIKKGQREGYIKVHLCENGLPANSKKYVITTKITEDRGTARTESIQQETEPVENFPWDDIFVCGYGTYRSKQADVSYEQYEKFNAIRSLFDHQTTLQNPELILLRQSPRIQEIIEEKLQNILMIDASEYQIRYTNRGLEVGGIWGELPFQTLSDGYRSTTIWVLDFIGWLIYAERFIDNPDIGGILIIDEIEQHLHPHWQRYIVQRLRQQFPKTQIIASTHTPLIAAGTADIDQSMLLKLDRQEDNKITGQIIDKREVAGKRADQVLTSHAFDLITTRNERSHDDVDQYIKLLGKKIRSPQEEIELENLRSIVKERLNNGETPAEQAVEKAVSEVLKNTVSNISPEILDLETRGKLQALFQPDN